MAQQCYVEGIPTLTRNVATKASEKYLKFRLLEKHKKLRKGFYISWTIC